MNEVQQEGLENGEKGNTVFLFSAETNFSCH